MSSSGWGNFAWGEGGWGLNVNPIAILISSAFAYNVITFSPPTAHCKVCLGELSSSPTIGLSSADSVPVIIFEQPTAYSTVEIGSVFIND